MPDKKKTQKLKTKNFNPSKYIDVSPTLSTEKKSKVVLTMGDYSPPSIADQRLVETLKKYAKLYEADTYVFVASGDVSEGYLDERQRVGMSQNVFGNIVYPRPVSDMLEALKICESEYTSVIVVCMQEEFNDISSCVIALKEELKFESINVIPYSDPVSYDVIAEHIISGDFTSFKQVIATPFRSSAKEMFEQLSHPFNTLSEGYLTERIRPMSYTERIKRAQTMRRYAKRIEIARERAATKRASPEKLRERARKRALEIIRSRILRNKEYADLSAIEKNVIDARLMNIPPAVIDRIATKMMPVVRKAETERFNKSHKHHHVSLSASSTAHKGHVNEAFGQFADAVIEASQTLNDLNDLIEAVETSNVERAQAAINKEKKADALKHYRMMTTAKHSDINKQASKRFAELQQNESSEVIQTIIQREIERKKMLDAVKDYEHTSGTAALPDDEKKATAEKIAFKHGLDTSKADQLQQMYDKYAVSKGHGAYYNIFDVTESEDPEESTPDQREWGTDSLTRIYKQETPGQYVEEKYKPKGLWYNIRKRREKGLRRLRPGEEGYPKTLNIDDKQ